MKSSKTKKAKQSPCRANRAPFCHGLRDGLPIGLGYLAVSFSLGIAARTQGLSAIQGFVASFLCNASAGEHMGFLVIGAGAGFGGDDGDFAGAAGSVIFKRFVSEFFGGHGFFLLYI